MQHGNENMRDVNLRLETLNQCNHDTRLLAVKCLKQTKTTEGIN